MNIKTSYKDYRNHQYSGPRKSRKRSYGQMKRHYGEVKSRNEVWCKKIKTEKVKPSTLSSTSCTLSNKAAEGTDSNDGVGVSTSMFTPPEEPTMSTSPTTSGTPTSSGEPTTHVTSTAPNPPMELGMVGMHIHNFNDGSIQQKPLLEKHQQAIRQAMLSSPRQSPRAKELALKRHISESIKRVALQSKQNSKTVNQNLLTKKRNLETKQNLETKKSNLQTKKRNMQAKERVPVNALPSYGQDIPRQYPRQSLVAGKVRTSATILSNNKRKLELPWVSPAQLDRCAECGQSIQGCMLVCVQCADSKWCSACAQFDLHPGHYLIRLPAHRPQKAINEVINTVKTLIKNKEAAETETEIEIEHETGSAASPLNEFYKEMGRSEDKLTVVDETDDEDAPSTQDEAAPSAQGEANKEQLVVVVKNEIQCEVDPLMSSTTDVQTVPQLCTEIKEEPIEIPIETTNAHSHTQQIPESSQMSEQNNAAPYVLKYLGPDQTKPVLLRKIATKKLPPVRSAKFHVFLYKKKGSGDAGPS